MRFPALPGKHAGEPYLRPHHLLAGRSHDPLPPHVVLCWQRPLLERVCSERPLLGTPAPAGLLLELAGTPGTLVRLSDELALALLPIGAPTVAIVLEELSTRGVRSVIGVGFAGGLGPDMRPGDVVVCSEALRDEGTSYHYLAPAPTVLPDAELTGRLRNELGDAAVGPTWTTDAPYRETVAEIAHFRSEGVLTVDMEAAALFAVASVCGVSAAAAFSVSDILDGARWQPSFTAADVGAALFQLFGAAERALLGPQSAT